MGVSFPGKQSFLNNCGLSHFKLYTNIGEFASKESKTCFWNLNLVIFYFVWSYLETRDSLWHSLTCRCREGVWPCQQPRSTRSLSLVEQQVRQLRCILLRNIRCPLLQLPTEWSLQLIILLKFESIPLLFYDIVIYTFSFR